MALTGEYLGMRVHVDELDQEHHAFFGWCGRHELRLQRCTKCHLMRCPPTTACPFCAHGESEWVPVSGRGTVYSYGEVHHAIQPVFKAYTPYMLLLVELDEQKGAPGKLMGSGCRETWRRRTGSWRRRNWWSRWGSGRG
ncbi:MAG: OB-fold domain-containing protein [Pseudomonadales bacterium]